MRQLIGMAFLSAVISAPPTLAQTGQKPIKIGVMIPATGPTAGGGAATRAGAEVAIDEMGGKVGERAIQAIFDDYQFKADVAIVNAKRLVEREKVDVLVGPDGTHACIAIRAYMAEQGIPWVATQCSGKEMSPPAKAASNFFRASFQFNQHHPTMAKYALEKLKYKRIIAVGLDYAAGYDETKAFTEAFVKEGGQVVDTIYMPLGAMDPSPYVGKLVGASADAVFVNLWGIDAARFIKAAAEFGLTKSTPFFANGTAVEESDTLEPAGEAAVGILNYRTYSASYDTPANRAFVERIQKKSGKIANQYAYAGYAAMLASLKAIAANSNSTDKASLLSALRKVEFEGPGGPFHFGTDQQSSQTLFIRKVVEANGQLRNEVVDIVPDVKAPVQQ